MTDRSLIRPIAVLAGAALAALVVWGSVTPALRGPVVLAFLLVGPGMALVHLLRLRDPLAEMCLAVALSIALDTLVASAFLYAGAWSPSTILVALIAVAVFGAGSDLVTAANLRRPPAPT